MSGLDPEELLQCPIVVAHLIRRKRFDTHLVKCRKASTIPYFQCDYNALHLFVKEELQAHHQVCPDRHRIELTSYQEPGRNNPFPIQTSNVDAEECWDGDNFESYNPNEHVESSGVIINHPCEQKSKKHELQMRQKERVQALEHDEIKKSRNLAQSAAGSAPSMSGCTGEAGPKKKVRRGGKGRNKNKGKGSSGSGEERPSTSGGTSCSSGEESGSSDASVEHSVPSVQSPRPGRQVVDDVKLDSLMEQIRMDGARTYTQKKKK